MAIKSLINEDGMSILPALAPLFLLEVLGGRVFMYNLKTHYDGWREGVISASSFQWYI